MKRKLPPKPTTPNTTPDTPEEIALAKQNQIEEDEEDDRDQLWLETHDGATGEIVMRDENGKIVERTGEFD